MWVLATTIAEVIPAVIGILGLGGLIFTALWYRRDDTTAVVNQQDVILKDMKVLNDELRTTAASLREERDACHTEVRGLRQELREAREAISGQITQLDKKIDGD